MCCSECKSDFTHSSIKVMRKEDDLYVIQITCKKCGKGFGTAFFGQCTVSEKNYRDEDLALNIQEGPAPIDYDDVLDAHKFIKELKDDWQKYIPEDLKKH